MLATQLPAFVVAFTLHTISGRPFSVAPLTHTVATYNSGTLTTTTVLHSLTSPASVVGPSLGLSSTSVMLQFAAWASMLTTFPVSDS